MTLQSMKKQGCWINGLDDRMEKAGYTSQHCMKRASVKGHDCLWLVYYTVDNKAGKCVCAVYDTVSKNVLSEKEQPMTESMFNSIVTVM